MDNKQSLNPDKASCPEHDNDSKQLWRNLTVKQMCCQISLPPTSGPYPLYPQQLVHFSANEYFIPWKNWIVFTDKSLHIRNAFLYFQLLHLDCLTLQSEYLTTCSLYVRFQEGKFPIKIKRYERSWIQASAQNECKYSFSVISRS